MTQTWRRHRCLGCHKTFTTREKIDWTGVVRIRSNQSTDEYDRDRLHSSLLRAASELILPANTISELCDSIEQDLISKEFFVKEEQPAEIIITAVLSVLERFNPHFALKYANQVYRGTPPLDLIQKLAEQR